MAFLSRQALRRLGFAAVGTDVSISDRASIHGASRIALGSHVRIDDFAILSAGVEGIRIGSYVHIACHCSLIGKALIEVGDLSTLSSRVAVYSSNDDYTGAGLTNPMLPTQYRRVTEAAGADRTTRRRRIRIGDPSRSYDRRGRSDRRAHACQPHPRLVHDLRGHSGAPPTRPIEGIPRARGAVARRCRAAHPRQVPRNAFSTSRLNGSKSAGGCERAANPGSSPRLPGSACPCPPPAYDRKDTLRPMGSGG